jgi:hypothetical protein
MGSTFTIFSSVSFSCTLTSSGVTVAAGAPLLSRMVA